MSLFLEQGYKLIRIDRTLANSEKKDLQEFILKHPEIIPVAELENNKDAEIEYVAPEFKGIDILVITNTGNIYIVETKRRSGDYKKAIGQGLTYAAMLWNNYGTSDEPSTEFIKDFNNLFTCGNKCLSNVHPIPIKEYYESFIPFFDINNALTY